MDDGTWLAAGLVDLQLNGFGGHDLNDHPTVETIRLLSAAVHASGTARFAPTLITAAEADIVGSLCAIAAARAADPALRHAMPFIHVEGPHIAPEDGPRGAHPRAHVRPPDLAEFDRWQEACGGIVGLVTLSPHWPNAPTYIAGLTARGVRVAIGHTCASDAAIAAAVDAGACLSTHLGNGIAVTLRRHPNPIWTQLAEPRLAASFIADGHHLSAAPLKVMLQAKGLDRSFLVSDAVALAGMKPGRYFTAVGGVVVLEEDGRLVVEGTPLLAGAATSLAQVVARVMRLAGLSLAEALNLASTTPCRFAGLSHELIVGAPADLIQFGWSEAAGIDVLATWVAGHRFFPKVS